MKQYNLFFIIQEDKQRSKLSKAEKQKRRRRFLKLCRKIRPQSPKPPP